MISMWNRISVLIWHGSGTLKEKEGEIVSWVCALTVRGIGISVVIDLKVQAIRSYKVR